MVFFGNRYPARLLLYLAGMRFYWKRLSSFILASLLLLAGSASSGFAGINVTYLYNLSNFYGPIPSSWAVPFVDKGNNEIFVVDIWDWHLSVFNASGMETYRFARAEELGRITDGAVDDEGNLILLISGNEEGLILVRCNYRGEPLAKINISTWAMKHLPEGFSGFSPDRVAYSQDRIYLADTERMRIIVAGTDGSYKASHDIGSLMESEKSKRESLNLAGFSVDREGNIYYTIPVIFKAYRLSPDGKISGFGKPGGRPGSFGIVGGIDTDADGNIFVVDTLRSVVMVFSKEFKFLTEFGGGGQVRGGLVSPKNMVVDPQGKIYVAQGGNRGISVFRVSVN
jgi:hypothetical protein